MNFFEKLFKRKRYEDEGKVKRLSRDELGLLPDDEELDENIFVKPEKPERVSTLRSIEKSDATTAVAPDEPVKKASKKPTPSTSSTTKSTNKSNSDTKTKAETKSAQKAESKPVTSEPKEKSSERLANFEIKKAKDGRFVFNLYASNHVIVATSQIYTTSQAAVNGINSVITNAKRAPIEDTTLKKFEEQSYPKWEIYLDKSEQFRFRLYAPNGNCICHSQGYTSKANCKNGIESIIKSCENSEITKAYLNKDEK